MTNKQGKTALIDQWPMVILACLTLGLAPFVPEPHIVGKVRWLLGGGAGMKLMDYFDFFMHAAPFILLIRLSILTIRSKWNKQNTYEQ
jgi:hypothetical protein